jgi:hypothetical protein
MYRVGVLSFSDIFFGFMENNKPIEKIQISDGGGPGWLYWVVLEVY